MAVTTKGGSVSTVIQARQPFELQALTALPCGCVVGDYRAEILDVELVSIEAKGPHCRLHNHAAEGVLGLAECGQLDTTQLDGLRRSEMAA